jgi:hypothetical protein
MMENITKKGDHRDMVGAVIDGNTLDSFFLGGGVSKQKSETRGS